MIERPERKVTQKQLSAENEYIKDTLTNLSADFDIPGYPVPTDEDLRQEYRSAAEEVKSKEKEHLQALQRLLTPLVRHYVEKTEMLLSSGKLEKMKWEDPALAPNFDALVDIIDEKDSLNERFDLANVVPSQKLQKYGRSPLEVSDFARHLALNAADLTESNLTSGGTRTERVLDTLIKEKFGTPRQETEHRAYFFQTLNLLRVNEVLWGEAYPDSVITTDVFHEYELLPVGQYGENFSRRLFRVMQVMLAASLPMKKEGEKLAMQNKEIFHRTARGRSPIRENVRFGGPHSLQEGILSLFQAIFLLTAEKISDYDNPDVLLRDLIEAQLPNQLAYSTPAGTIGPLSLMGRYIPGLVQKNDTGKLILNPEIKNIFLEQKKKHLAEKVRSTLTSEGYEPPLPAVGRGCPVSFESKIATESGIQSLSNLLLKTYEHTKKLE